MGKRKIDKKKFAEAANILFDEKVKKELLELTKKKRLDGKEILSILLENSIPYTKIIAFFELLEIPRDEQAKIFNEGKRLIKWKE